MKLPDLFGAGLAVAFLLFGLAACQDFDKGDVVKASVGRVQGDPCLISLQLDSNNQRYGRGMVARLATPECQAQAPAAPQGR